MISNKELSPDEFKAFCKVSFTSAVTLLISTCLTAGHWSPKSASDFRNALKTKVDCIVFSKLINPVITSFNIDDINSHNLSSFLKINEELHSSVENNLQ